MPMCGNQPQRQAAIPCCRNNTFQWCLKKTMHVAHMTLHVHLDFGFFFPLPYMPKSSSSSSRILSACLLNSETFNCNSEIFRFANSVMLLPRRPLRLHELRTQRFLTLNCFAR